MELTSEVKNEIIKNLFELNKENLTYLRFMPILSISDVQRMTIRLSYRNKTLSQRVFKKDIGL